FILILLLILITVIKKHLITILFSLYQWVYVDRLEYIYIYIYIYIYFFFFCWYKLKTKMLELFCP
ncbi:MAG: hypothetical protein N7Q72_04760, partial [Spiroplasma sp. Tabriz.8]|nr:hypothetical protein [Spiroplasma sp. Tabriz.8]